MKEYKSSLWPVQAAKVNTENFDKYLNAMEDAGWQLHTTTPLIDHWGRGSVLCVFVTDRTASNKEPGNLTL